MIARLAALSVVCLLAFGALGWWVAHHALGRIDIESVAWRGRAIPLAIVFTNSGYGFGLTALGIATIAGALVMRVSVVVPSAILISQIASQAAVNALKGVFARPRPDAWLYRHELGYSYPSGHATTAIVFFGSWLVVALLAPLPPAIRLSAAVLLGLWALGIGWSRIALGAHYPTDVIGGYLFGLAWLCATMAGALARHAGSAAHVA